MGGTRASYYFGAMSVAWAALGLIQLIPQSMRHSVPLMSALIALFSGLIVGSVVSAVFSRRQLRVLAAKGEAKGHLVTQLLLFGALCVACGAYLLVVGESVEMVLVAWMFASPMGVAALAARAVVFFSWERKNNRVILFTSAFSSKLRVFPELSSSAVQ